MKLFNNKRKAENEMVIGRHPDGRIFLMAHENGVPAMIREDGKWELCKELVVEELMEFAVVRDRETRLKLLDEAEKAFDLISQFKSIPSCPAGHFPACICLPHDAFKGIEKDLERIKANVLYCQNKEIEAKIYAQKWLKDYIRNINAKLSEEIDKFFN